MKRDQCLNASGDDRRFSGTGAGQYEGRPVFVQDRFLLFRIEWHDIP